MYKNGDKVRLKNGCIVIIKGPVSSIDSTEGYFTEDNIVIAPEMIDKKIN